MTAPERVLAKPIDPYATYIPSRRPEFKTHSIFSHAKLALINKSGVYSTSGKFTEDCVLYCLSGGEWYVPIITVTAGSSREDYPDLAKKPPAKSQLALQLEMARRRALSYTAEAEKARNEYVAMLLKENGVTLVATGGEDLPEGIVAAIEKHVKLTASSWDKLTGECPFCKSAGFHVSPAKAVWYCFGCSRGGGHADFLEQMG